MVQMPPTDLRTAELKRAAPAVATGFVPLLLAAAGRRNATSGDMADAEALVVFAFGAGIGRRAGRTNAQLAVAAAEWPDLPVLAQSEVAAALSRRGRMVVDIESDLRERRGLGPTTYVDTSMIAEATASMIRAAGWSRVAVLSHPAHTGRCAASLERLGLTPIVPDLRGQSIDFDPESAQWWTRSRVGWLLRESLVLAHHKVLRKL